jgi:hypothetical protein
MTEVIKADIVSTQGDLASVDGEEPSDGQFSDGMRDELRITPAGVELRLPRWHPPLHSSLSLVDLDSAI